MSHSGSNRYIGSIIFYLGYFLALGVAGTLMTGLAFLMPRPQRFHFILLYNRFLVFWFRLCCGVRYQVEGLDQLPAQPCVFLSNHQSEWETIYLQIVKVPTCTVLKKELLKLPVFGWGLRVLEPIALDRSKRAGALKTVLKTGSSRLQSGHSVLIFPEGTRVLPGQRLKYARSGASLACRAGAPVVPIAHNAGERWGRGLIKRSGTLTVRFGPAIETAGRSPDEVTAEVEAWIEQQLSEISEVPRPPQADAHEANDMPV
ncbi:acyl-phosphate glycerol 3-phosphate acyltransferase [Terasakiispira papahanaumokuakeensis]|uniref:Acyl-phosphate glycerol 3-phosphate acyltransferase n=1 Tax=Terasakiispira papahanaumokuakeensis TaxID=197479 RepID=A0A1E2VC89_9GAMM|nr:lysophospholipid acyltransferase family protein [Terasakiispira papahanaumokuakeensis]ODC04617.1 acyl-phosphate glycerol 3-phosphate acyltransferase [Terasakiispira papahanaumokuakeensis]